MPLGELRNIVAQVERDIANGPIVPDVAPHDIRSYLASRYDFTKPMALEDVAVDVQEMMRKWHVQVTHPRYFGLFNPSVTLASVVADTLVAMYNPQLATWRTSPAANEIERHTLAWLAEKFGLPATASANFTTGGAEANLSAVIVALTRAFPEYGDAGLRSLSASPTIYLTREAHDSFVKIAHVTGIGRQALRTVAIDRDLEMDVGDLERQVGEDRRKGLAPVMVERLSDIRCTPLPKSGALFELKVREFTPIQPISEDSLPYSILGQRFITTLTPAASAMAAASSLRTPSCIQMTCGRGFNASVSSTTASA